MPTSTDFFPVHIKNFYAGIDILEDGPVTEENYKRIIRRYYDFYDVLSSERVFLGIPKAMGLREAKKMVCAIRKLMNTYYEFNVCAEIILLGYPSNNQEALKIINLSGEKNNSMNIIDFARDIRRRTIEFFDGIVTKIYNDSEHKNDAKQFSDILIIAKQQESEIKGVHVQSTDAPSDYQYWWQRY